MSLQEEDVSPEFARKHFLTGLSEGLPERKDASVSILFTVSAHLLEALIMARVILGFLCYVSDNKGNKP